VSSGEEEEALEEQQEKEWQEQQQQRQAQHKPQHPHVLSPDDLVRIHLIGPNGLYIYMHVYILYVYVLCYMCRALLIIPVAKTVFTAYIYI
jgi:hypothetical protein